MTRLEGIRLIVFDLDGTLRRARHPLRSAPRDDADWSLLPGVRETLERVRARHPDLVFGIASNQDDVAAGRVDFARVERLARETTAAAGIPDAHIEICPHGDAGCSCHKPEPGMLRRLAAHARAEPGEVLVVGNGENDREAARRFGARFVAPSEFFARRPRGPLELVARLRDRVQGR